MIKRDKLLQLECSGKLNKEDDDGERRGRENENVELNPKIFRVELVLLLLRHLMFLLTFSVKVLCHLKLKAHALPQPLNVGTQEG